MASSRWAIERWWYRKFGDVTAHKWTREPGVYSYADASAVMKERDSKRYREQRELAALAEADELRAELAERTRERDIYHQLYDGMVLQYGLPGEWADDLGKAAPAQQEPG